MNNEIAKTEATAAVKAQDDSTIDGAYRIATAMSKTQIVPKHFQGKPADCFLALQTAKRMKLDTMAVMQNIYIVHGQPAFSAKFLIALANNSGTFATPIMFRYSGEGDTLTATAYAIHKASHEEVSFDFSYADAVAEGYHKNPKYKSMRKLMLSYRAATLFTRLYCPESVMGIGNVEENEDLHFAQQPQVDAGSIFDNAKPATGVTEEEPEVPAEDQEPEAAE